MASRIFVNENGPMFFGLLASSVIFLTFVIFSSSRSGLKQAADVRQGSDVILRALQGVLVPTRSHWPLLYRAISESMHRSREKALFIPLSKLLRDCGDGSVELRDAKRTLPELLSGRAAVKGCRVCLQVDLAFRTAVSLWLAKTQCFPPTFMPKAFLANRLKSSQGSQKPGYDHIRLDLDTVPYSGLQPLIRHLQAKLPKDFFASIEFTARDAAISVLDPSFALMAVPFLSDRLAHKSGTKNNGNRQNRSSLALIVSLVEVIGLLTSKSAPLTILSVENISVARFEALDQEATMLELDSGTRSAFMSCGTLQEWREECLYLHWESALLKTGLLTRWKIIVGR
ncbi:hypothetical protein EWM64_g1446 [Hericium alpestre]|uniref:Uncharacterized protein n=1 Tax=Hericium alpestre TaxID=135208 RepID=A0A4Z0AAK4_9AGAM|nr:hypothetical protein EWM64_g1446 [Hericium alpestre]